MVGEVRAVFGRDDEPELMAIVGAALDEGSAIGAVLAGRIELARSPSREVPSRWM